MNIRSVTFGINRGELYGNRLEHYINSFLRFSNEYFAKANFKVRTNRLNLPLLNYPEEANISHIREMARIVDEICQNGSLRWFCIPVSTFGYGDLRVIFDTLLQIINRHPSAFINLIVAKEKEISFQGILHASKFIQKVSKLSSTGYDNFRVGVSCNCQPNSPFFPFTYQEGQPGFSIALELTGIFIRIIKNLKCNDLQAIRKVIIKEIAPHLKIVEQVGCDIEKETSMKYYGTDISLAPFPGEDNSVAQLIEMLGVESFGGNGTLFITSYLTDILRTLIKETNLTGIGFNGVMFSLLEDSGVNKRNNSRRISIYSLLAYCSVCGCGIDMVPIPGDTFDEEIASLILDVAGLSCALDKPLGVRLLPVPLKRENELSDYNYDFLHNTRIKGLGNVSCSLQMFENRKFNYHEPTELGDN